MCDYAGVAESWLRRERVMPHPLIHRLLGATCKLTIKSPIMDSTECVYTIGDEDVEVEDRKSVV